MKYFSGALIFPRSRLSGFRIFLSTATIDRNGYHWHPVAIKAADDQHKYLIKAGSPLF